MYTTKLLDVINDRMPRRHQVIAAVLIVFLTVASIAGSVASRPAAQASPRVIILIATPTRAAPASAHGLAKLAAPQMVPGVELSAPTAAPLPAVVIVTQTKTQHVRRVGEKPSDKPGPGGE